jgi:peptidoglycan-N-acetylglucosamine deacetylase
MLSPFAEGIYAGLAGAGALGLAVSGYAYASMWPGSQIFGPTLIAPRRRKEVALTFDDGPNPAWTPRLLEILAAHDVRATFFMVGRFAQSQPALVREVAQAGHIIGNHSWSHPNLARTPSGKVREELRRTSDALEQILGARVRFFRPPYGARRPLVLRTARGLGMTPVTWNAMTSDWSETSAGRIADALIARVEKNASRGWAANIVLHDGGHRGLGADRGPSVNAAEKLLAHFAGKKRLVTLDAWTTPASVPS